MSSILKQRDPGPLPRLLIVDDEEVIRSSLEELLADRYQIETAQDGEAAEEAMFFSHFDVVLSDVNMPGGSGLEMLRRLRELDPETPVIIMSATPTLANATEALSHGAFRYLSKPVHGKELFETLGRAVAIGRRCTRRITRRRAGG